MKELDLLNIPLHGTHLIEASAGTGKTYTIAFLFLRLLLEDDVGIEEILVVTFTVPATNELKERVRKNIRAALKAFESGSSDDEILNGLVKRSADRAGAIRRLKNALMRFDEAAIFTIHGFCQRMLHEMSFESRSYFDAEIISDPRDIVKEVVEDFYRLHFYTQMPPELVSYALNKGYTVRFFLNLLDKASLDSMIIPEIQRPRLDELLQSSSQAFEELRNKWTETRKEVEDILLNDKGLRQNIYKKKSIPKLIEEMDIYMSSESSELPLFENFVKFTSSKLGSSLKNGFDPPRHIFFDMCDDFAKKADTLQEEMNLYLTWLKRELFEYVHAELPKKKEKMGVLHFDDLLVNMRDALASRHGDALIRAVRQKFSAALIDEFQDTDPVQYEIFRTIFSDGALFLIGDPKQAIYSFRGADIFTYMKASGDVDPDNRHTLKMNWRSEPGLIDAVNTMFSRVKNPFVYERIGFEKVAGADKEERKELKEVEDFSFKLWFLPSVYKTCMNISDAGSRIVRGVAAEISRLLELGDHGMALIGDKPVEPRDIAVLVRSHSQARKMRDILSSLNIPCVLYSDEDVFDSREALEMEMVLNAIAEPARSGLIRSALMTRIMGNNSRDIEDIIENDQKGEELIERFMNYHDLWERYGFIYMFRRFMAENEVRSSLLAFPDGERTLTNILHISELLGRAAIEKRLGITHLLKWLSEQRDRTLTRPEEYQLRLESDGDAVKIVTIHKSKGLEYPIVFCPFNWGKSKLQDKDNFSFHDEANDNVHTLDLGSDNREDNSKIAEKEQLAENMRLLYVALTRAENRCYLVWGNINNSETSPLAYLLHHKHIEPGQDILNSMECIKDLGNEEMLKDLDALVNVKGTHIFMEPLPGGMPSRYVPASRKETTLSCREFKGRIERSWGISSFSSLASGISQLTDAADHDALYLMPVKEEAKEEIDRADIFSFPRGARSGTMLHKVFELLDFTADDSSKRGLIAEILDQYGFEARWKDAVFNMVKKVLDSPLEKDRRDLMLSRIRPEHRFNELEFWFPLKTISRDSLKRIFAEFCPHEVPGDFPEMIGDLHFEPAEGFMRGFIDLIFSFDGRFYLIDWKSNYLGPRVEDYNQHALMEMMKSHYYILQYHLYTVALNQYLKMRLKGYKYDEHFGGVYYIFLRGVDPAVGPDYGIFRARPSNAIIEALTDGITDGVSLRT
ncbi:MAG: exodeoxyribonuclease V subunit beta [Deltaproteobacteria bacterium]|nr:exodeoxyribonuclease V subunit beta [Deltaproteobacteria bacterium]